MKEIIKPGDQKIYQFRVGEDDTAAFHGEQVHPVCSTFVLAREIEWSSRLFVLEMKEEDEEGIGTQLSIQHASPAFIGEKLEIVATVKSLVKNEIICTYEVRVEDRLIAHGETGQKVMLKERINKILGRNGE